MYSRRFSLSRKSASTSAVFCANISIRISIFNLSKQIFSEYSFGKYYEIWIWIVKVSSSHFILTVTNCFPFLLDFLHLDLLYGDFSKHVSSPTYHLDLEDHYPFLYFPYHRYWFLNNAKKLWIHDTNHYTKWKFYIYTAGSFYGL